MKTLVHKRRAHIIELSTLVGKVMNDANRSSLGLARSRSAPVLSADWLCIMEHAHATFVVFLPALPQ